MEKIYNAWNNIKIFLSKEGKEIFCNKREIWWCSLGMNLGKEMFGKNDLFERPVLVLKVYNKETIKIVPLSSKEKTGDYYVKIKVGDISSSAVLSQVRTISTKRLSRKVSRLDKLQFNEVIRRYKDTI